MNKKRILLIDDEPSFTNVLKLNLEETGAYEVRAEKMEVVFPNSFGACYGTKSASNIGGNQTGTIYLVSLV